jgi:hypothetical protein
MTDMNRRSGESGAANTWLILSVVFIVTTLAAVGVMVWALVNYTDQKNNVDSKVSLAVATAKKEQADADEAKFNERDKEPNRQFVGPEDFGRVSFNYPKTWSVYIEKDAVSTSTFEAYLNPVAVPPVSSTQQYALRVLIESKDYDQVISSYQALVKKGDLKSSAVKADNEDGTRLDGQFTKDIRGSAVIFKIRDKTLTIRSDADTFRGDFDALIATITFNK